jgi:hypothetical protein
MLILSPKQSQAMDAIASEQYSFILFGGAMGGGKTFWGLSALLVMCELFPGSRWCVIREDLEKIRITTIPSFKKLEPGGTLRESPFNYTHPNGSIILFKGENYDHDKDLQWLKGLEVNGFLFEEINECQQDTFELAFSRAGRWECANRPKPIILATCNPAKNWVKTLVYDRWVNNTLPPNWLYLPSSIEDNPYLTPDYKQNLTSLPRYKYEVFVKGNWDVQLKTGGEFYKCFNIQQHTGSYPYNPVLPLHISWDDNVNPYLPCGIFQIAGTELRMVGEIAATSPGNTVNAVCNEIQRLYPAHAAGMFIYGDATANKQDTKLEKGYNFFRLVVDNLRRYHPVNRVLASNPSVVMRGNWINTVFEKEPHGLRFRIDERCKCTITDFTCLKEAADGTKLKEMETHPITKIRHQKLGHFTDLFDYIACSAFAGEFAAWQKGSASPLPVVGRNVSRNSY